MIYFSLKLQFSTKRPISQETGLEMWKLGSHFMAVKGCGGRTYQVTATGQSMSLMDAINVLSEAIKKNVELDAPNNEATITMVEGKAE